MAVTHQPDAGNIRTGSPAVIALAWTVVAVPAAWGIYNTVLRAAHLFTR